MQNSHVNKVSQESFINADSLSVEMSQITNVVLRRLAEEVQREGQNNVSAYNRTHNRHNRSTYNRSNC